MKASGHDIATLAHRCNVPCIRRSVWYWHDRCVGGLLPGQTAVAVRSKSKQVLHKRLIAVTAHFKNEQLLLFAFCFDFYKMSDCFFGNVYFHYMHLHYSGHIQYHLHLRIHLSTWKYKSPLRQFYKNSHLKIHVISWQYVPPLAHI